MSKTGNNSIKKYKICSEVNQFIYSLVQTCLPSIRILAKGVLQIFCSQGYSYMKFLCSKQGNNSIKITKNAQKLISSSTPKSERRRGRVVRAARLQRRKSPYSVTSRLGFAMRRLENSLCQPSSKWVPLSN